MTKCPHVCAALALHHRARFDNLHAINEDGSWGIGALSKQELRRSFVVPIGSGLLRMTALGGGNSGTSPDDSRGAIRGLLRMTGQRSQAAAVPVE